MRSSGRVYTFTASLASLRKKGVVLLLFRYENIVGCPFAQQADIQISYIPKYGKESIETDDDVLGYEIYDENVELSVSSLTAQIVEKQNRCFRSMVVNLRKKLCVTSSVPSRLFRKWT